MQTTVLQQLTTAGVVPVVRVKDPDQALKLADALVEGGLECVEITFTVPGAAGVIASLRRRFPNLLVGAGTVLSEWAAAAAIDAGARFIVSPATVAPVIEVAHRLAVPAIPGVLTPTEAVRALEMGAEALKLFPASTVGPGYLKAVRAVFPGVTWCPTGGIELDNLADWLKAGASFVGVGSPLLGDVEATGDYASVTARARAYVARLRELRGH